MADVCCCGEEGRKDNHQNCILCGKPLIYYSEERMLECCICHKTKPANASCEDGHYVCDECHENGGGAILDLLLHSREKNPLVLLEQVFWLPQVHLHGPEHHSIVPCVLITSFHNCGGDIQFERCLYEAWTRGKKIPGGACGFLGVCGAAAGAGVFASIVSGATPLTERQWEIPQRLTVSCLEAIAGIGGPRCCKRTCRIAIEHAAAFSEIEFGISMPITKILCRYWVRNNECIRQRCPYFPHSKSNVAQKNAL